MPKGTRGFKSHPLRFRLTLINSITTRRSLFMKWFRLILLIILCQSAGIIGSFFTVSSVKNWYVYLNKPSFSPPNWLFAPAWFTLYTLMGIALYLVWKNKPAVRLFLIHLFFNAIWSIIFFGLQNPLVALLDIILLWSMIIMMIVKFWKINKVASYLLIPYFFWVSFATLLNFSVWRLN